MIVFFPDNLYKGEHIQLLLILFSIPRQRVKKTKNQTPTTISVTKIPTVHLHTLYPQVKSSTLTKPALTITIWLPCGLSKVTETSCYNTSRKKPT
jgi:hypothetical protein